MDAPCYFWKYNIEIHKSDSLLGNLSLPPVTEPELDAQRTFRRNPGHMSVLCMFRLRPLSSGSWAFQHLINKDPRNNAK